jgi:transposase-like protein
VAGFSSLIRDAFRRGRPDVGRSGLALVVLSIVEQRLDAVRTVLEGVPLTEVAAQVGVHRATLHRWVTRYLVDGLAGLSDRSHRPVTCPHQVATAVEVTVAEIRREHPTGVHLDCQLPRQRPGTCQEGGGGSPGGR